MVRTPGFSDEHWWSGASTLEDLDLWFSAYALSADSTRRPLLLLGHPGAGKSMLMQVLAARLPAQKFTVVLVPLRAVGASAPILDQIQLALDQATHRRVDWPTLSDETMDTIRVVILDGLDELLQASNADRSGYLQDVMDFQRVETEQGRPVICIVTSRTVVADRVDVPHGTAVVKLQDFSESQIARWLSTWNSTNATQIDNETIHGLSVEAALSQYDLAKQPLLLLMLALYSANPNSPTLESGLSKTDLYQRIIHDFARRQVAKGNDFPLTSHGLRKLWSDSASPLWECSTGDVKACRRRSSLPT